MARVLIIDDDAQLRVVLRAILERGGYEVVEAPDGRVGMQRYQETPTDVMLLDLFMPGQEGLETIGALQRLDPHVKIIAISGGGTLGSTQDYLETAAALGAQRTLRKPFSPQELLTVVHDVLQDA